MDEDDSDDDDDDDDDSDDDGEDEDDEEEEAVTGVLMRTVSGYNDSISVHVSKLHAVTCDLVGIAVSYACTFYY